MSISTNFYYDYKFYENEKLPDFIVMRDIMYAYKLGIPAIYYFNSEGESSEGYGNQQDDCESGACKI